MGITNRKGNFYQLCKELEETFNDNVNEEDRPERGLFAAILERAFRDLEPKTTHKNDWLDAIEWFMKPFGFDDGGICYTDCIRVLDLTPEQVNFINGKVQEAKEYGKQPAER